MVCALNALTDEALHFTDKDKFNEWFHSAPRIFVGHNAVSFDVPVINRLWQSRIGISRVVDTFVLSMLYSPSLSGGHSLESWGHRVKLEKFVHKDFTQYSEEMLRYCQRDCEVTKRLYVRLAQRMLQVGFKEKGAELETLSWNIIQNKQKRHGFPFDYERGHQLLIELRAHENELREQVQRFWPPELRVVETYKRPFKRDGTPTANYLRHLEQFPEIRVTGPDSYEALDWVEFNLGSPSQRVAKLTDAGWVPTSFTKAGNPKVDEESLLKFAETSGNSAATALAKWVVTNSRANMVNTWLNAYKEETRAIHGNLWIASTLRYRHDNPNSANVPAVRVGPEGPRMGEEGSWTYEARDLWTCGDYDRYRLVGVDAKGIQLRVLANYLEDEQFTAAILSEDPHSANQQRLNLPTRALTKTITYATLMGAGDARIAAEADVPLKDARSAKRRFMEQIPGLPKLIQRLQRELQQTGRITLCDGSRVLVSSDHMVIPYLLQGDESRIMKQASIYLDQAIRKNKVEAYKVGDIHDEWQFVVRKEMVDDFVQLALESFPRAGQTFNYNVLIEGDAKVGLTWAETH